MPQLDQLPMIFLSQLFWLLVVFGFIYFVIGRGMVPKIQSTIDAREKKIDDDLAAAEAARMEADATEAKYRERMDASRAEAAKLTGEARDASARSTEQKLVKADGAIAAKLAKADERIRAARSAAVGAIETLAAELARDITGQVAGLEVPLAETKSAVKAVMSHA